MDSNFSKIAPIYFLYERDTERSAQISTILRDKYLGNQTFTEDTLPGLANVTSNLVLETNVIIYFNIAFH